MPKTKKGGSTAVERANELVGNLGDRIAPTMETARGKAAPLVAGACEKAGPALAGAREKAAPALEGAKDRFTTGVLPALTAAVAASSATEEVREETKKRSMAAVAALRGEVEAPKKTHRFRNFLVALGLGGIAAAVTRKLSARPATTTWQSQPTSSPAGSPLSTSDVGTHRAPIVVEEGTDQGGASPDVAAADAAATPHPATTPDDPATTVDVTQK